MGEKHHFRHVTDSNLHDVPVIGHRVHLFAAQGLKGIHIYHKHLEMTLVKSLMTFHLGSAALADPDSHFRLIKILQAGNFFLLRTAAAKKQAGGHYYKQA